MWKQSEIERLQEATYHRKNVRKFKPESVTSEVLNDIMQKTEELTALQPKSKVAFRLLDGSQVKSMNTGKTMGTAHYLAVYAERGLESYVNAAFMLHQMALWLPTQGIGSWWSGKQPKSEFANADGLPHVFILTFGIPDEELYRKDPSEYKRKPLSNITDITGMERILESVRLAPSAINRQPWYITGDARSLHLHGKKDNLLMNAMSKDLMYIDVGIALCHLWLATSKENKFIALEREPNQESISGKYEYIWTVHLKA